MGIFNFFSKPDTAQSPVADQAVVATGSDRRGMWVMTSEGVGILTGDNEVTLVDADGTNAMTIVNDVAVPKIVVVDEVVQAYVEDIPEGRRADPYFMQSLGYKNKEVQ